MSRSERLALVQEFFFLLSASEADELNPIDIAVKVDLGEFAFTEEEIRKLERLARRLELALLAEFTRCCAVASVIVEIRSDSQ